MGIELTANHSGEVTAENGAGEPVASVTGTTMTGIDVGGTLMGEPLYRPQQQALAVSGVVAEVQPYFGYVTLAGATTADGTGQESSEVSVNVLQQAGIGIPLQCTGEQAKYRDGSMMSNVEALWMYSARRDGRAACTIYIIGVPFLMSEQDFCTPFLHVGEVVALFFPREKWQDYRPYGTCTIRYRDPQHASEAVEQFNGAMLYRRLKPLWVQFAEQEFGIDAPQDREESFLGTHTLGKPRFFGNVPNFPVEDGEQPDADWVRRSQANRVES